MYREKRPARNRALQEMATAEFKRARRDGTVRPLPCEVCGTTRNVNGHHEDYAYSLEVIWLCPRHHRQRHRFGYTIEKMRRLHQQ